MLSTGLMFLLLLMLCAFLCAKCKVNASLAPLLSLSIVMLYFSLAGVLNVLVAAGWLFVAACFGLFVFVLIKKGAKNVFKNLQSLGFLLFVACGAVTLVYFAVRAPEFIMWDEFSLWGAAPKLMKLNNEMYSVAEMGWDWTATQRPAMIVLGYFTQFLSNGFEEWKVYFACNLLLFACTSAMLAPFKNKKLQYAVPVAFIGLMLPFLFGVTSRAQSLATPYLSSYADLPAGIMFGSVLVSFFYLRQKNKPIWPSVVMLGAFSLVKDNTFPVALVAMGVMVADLFLFSKGSLLAGSVKKEDKPHKKFNWVAFCMRVAGLFAAVFGTSFVWGKYAAYANSLKGGSETGVSVLDSAVLVLKQMFGILPHEAVFDNTASGMKQAFFNKLASGEKGTQAVSMFGSCFFMVCLILIVFVFAVFMAQKGRMRKRIVCALVLTAGGFMGYLFVLFVSYAYLFKGGEGVTDFARYISSYLPGALMLAICLLVLAVPDMGSCASNGGKLTLHRQFKKIAMQICLLGFCAALVLQFARLVPKGYSVLDYDESVYAQRKQEKKIAQSITQNLPKGSRTFFVSQGDDGEKWFHYSYDFLPNILDFSFGGGTIGSSKNEETADEYYIELTEKQFKEYLEENECDYIFAQNIDELFVKTYGKLFSDGLESAKKAPALYALNKQGVYQPSR